MKPKNIVNCVILHIQYLLRHHSCVIMPRLGALIATERSAGIDEQWGIIRAPMREICFNAAIVNNDGLLATSIARREQVSYEAACRLMESGIEELKHTLDSIGEVNLGRIGLLRRTADGRLRFEPSVTAEQQAANLGFSTVALPASPEQEANPKVSRRDNRYYHLRISKYAVRVAASMALPIVAAIGILLWTVSLGDGSRTMQQIDYASVLPVPRENATVHTPSAAPDSQQVTSEPKGRIVVAVFQSAAQAELFMQQHAGSPYALTVDTYGNAFRVSAGGSHGRSALVKMLHTTDFIVEYPGAWIWMEE